MFNFKSILIIFIIGLVAGIFSSGIIVPVLVSSNFLNSASILSKFIKPGPELNKIEKEVALVSQPGLFFEAIKKKFDSRAWHGMLQLRRDADVVALNPRIQLEALWNVILKN